MREIQHKPGIRRSDNKHPAISTIEPDKRETTLIDWLATNSAVVDAEVLHKGALLLRDFSHAPTDGLADFLRSLDEAPIDYIHRSTPRRALDSGIYTASEYRPQSRIPLHSENSFQKTWPLRLYFYCVESADSGGATILSDMEDVTSNIDDSISAKWNEKEINYTRNYHEGIDLPWQVVFQTESKRDVEKYCEMEGIAATWVNDAHLRTTHTSQASAIHPQTHRRVWFNQAHLFHVSNLGPEIQDSLLRLYGEQGVPRNSSLGDGTPLHESELANVREAFDRAAFTISLAPGDLLIVDNMRMAHGREPYAGGRQIHVAMTRPFRGSSNKTGLGS